MTDSYRVLIVDDQRDIRQVLKDGLESLDAGFEVWAVPSGEEALLESGRITFDLLVADMRLPGMTGLELLQRLRKKASQIKVILVTGATDVGTRRQAADAKADAFFLKPIELADFLDEVERLFGLVEMRTLPTPVEAPGEDSRKSISEYLVNLRQQLNAFSVLLIDDRGRVLVQTGDLPDSLLNTSFVAKLMAAFSASLQVGNYLQQMPPQDFLCFGGKKYDLFLTHVGKSYGLLTVGNRNADNELTEYFGKIGADLQLASQDISRMLKNMGVTTHIEEQMPLVLMPHENAMFVEEEVAEEEGELSPEIEALFTPNSSKKLTDADTFWDSLERHGQTGQLLNADVLSYDQAVQLGLAPQDDDEK